MFSITRHHWRIVFLLSIDVRSNLKNVAFGFLGSGAKTIEEAKAIAQADHNCGLDAD